MSLNARSAARAKIGLPLYDVFSVRSGEAEKAYLIGGDKAAVLGKDLAD